MNETTIGYLVYLAIGILLTVWVARTLSRNGQIFLLDAYPGNEPMAGSVSHLLSVGFYLLNVGFVSLALPIGTRPVDRVSTIEYVCTKIGMVLLVLGAMHFLNVFLFSRMRRRGLLRHAPPPVAPREYL